MFDPNNHVPEVSPDDRWEDTEEYQATATPGQVVLPARRTEIEPGTTLKEAGLRISPNVTRCDPSDSSQQLEVQEISGEVIRLEKSSEAPQRVERQIAFQERQVVTKPRNLGKDMLQLTMRLRSRWMLGMGVTVTLMVIASLMMLPSINAPNAPHHAPSQRVLSVVDNQKIEGVEDLSLLISQQQEAIALYRSYVLASSVDEIIPLVADSNALEEVIRENWHPLGAPRAWEPAEDSTWVTQESNGRPYAILEGDLHDQSKFKAYFVHRDGKLLLDWKATEGYGSATFGELENGTGDGSEVRGILSNAEFYSSVWPESDYRSYRLISPDRKEMVWCYARRGGVADSAIIPLFNGGEIIGDAKNNRTVTLSLARGPDGARPNQWLIPEILHIEWATP